MAHEQLQRCRHTAILHWDWKRVLDVQSTQSYWANCEGLEVLVILCGIRCVPTWRLIAPAFDSRLSGELNWTEFVPCKASIRFRHDMEPQRWRGRRRRGKKNFWTLYEAIGSTGKYIKMKRYRKREVHRLDWEAGGWADVECWSAWMCVDARYYRIIGNWNNSALARALHIATPHRIISTKHNSCRYMLAPALALMALARHRPRDVCIFWLIILCSMRNLAATLGLSHETF